MTDLPPLAISPQDVLAALGFEAQRIVAGVQQHAAGYPFPPADQIQQVLDRMQQLNRTLLDFMAKNAAANAKSGMEATLN